MLDVALNIWAWAGTIAGALIVFALGVLIGVVLLIAVGCLIVGAIVRLDSAVERFNERRMKRRLEEE